jgi:hypothetical protein
MRLKSSGVIRRREFVTRDPDVRIDHAGACRDVGCGRYALLAARPEEQERSEISGGGAGRRLDGTPRNARHAAKAAHHVRSPAEAGHYVRGDHARSG